MTSSVQFTGLPSLTAPAGGDILAAVDISDSTSGPSGTSKQITASALVRGVGLAVYNVKDAAYGARGDWVTDDTAAFQAAITAARAGGGGIIFMPPGDYLITTSLNLTMLSENGIILQGSGATEYGTVGGSTILGNVGHGNPVIDTTGSSYYQFRDFTIYCTAAGLSSIGILQGRALGLPDALFNERWVIKNVNIIMESRAAATNKGTIGVYSCCAEDGAYDSMWIIADAPFQFRDNPGWITNPLTGNPITSPFTGTLTGPASMTSVQIRSSIAQAYLWSAIEFSNAHNFDIQLITSPQSAANAQPAYNFNGNCSSIRMWGGQEDAGPIGWMAVANFNNSCHAITFDKTAAGLSGVGGGLFLLQAGVELSGCVIRIRQLNGTIQKVFNCAGSNVVKGSTIYCLDTLQTVGTSDLRLDGCLIMSSIANPIATLAAGSTFTVMGPDGIVVRDKGFFDVRAFGAVGDGTTNDTVAVQAAATAAAVSGGVVYFPATTANTYVVTTITVSPGTTVESEAGVVITRPASRPNFERIFTTEGWAGSAADSKPVVFRNLTVDGNRANQGPYSAYQLQQSHCIYVGGNATTAGRMVAVFENVTVRENVADGISIANDTVCSLVNTTGLNCFRGAVTLQGGRSTVDMVNLEITNTDTICQFGLHIEIDTAGYGGAMDVHYTLTNAKCNAQWSFQGGSGSEMRLVNAQGGTGTVAAPSTTIGSLLGVVFEAVNCRFDFGITSALINRIVDPINATFVGCEFRVNRQGAAGGVQDFQAADIYWEVLDSTGLRRCRFKSCQFTTTGLAGGDTATAIFSQANLLAHDDQLILDGCEIETGYTTGLRITQGGVFRVRGLRNNAVTPFYVSCSGGGYDFNGKLDTIELGSLATSYMNMVSHQATSTIEHENVTVDETQNTIATTFGVVNNVYRGRRVVLGTAAPGAAQSGFRGDVWRLKTPVAGAIFEWVCTTSSATAAVWSPLISAGAIESVLITPTEAVLVSGVDAATGSAVKVTLTAGRAVGAPLNPTTGQRLVFLLVQDGTGGWNVTWNAVFKKTWSDTGNTASKRSSIAFVYDGTNWNQDGAQTPYV